MTGLICLLLIMGENRTLAPAGRIALDVTGPYSLTIPTGLMIRDNRIHVLENMENRLLTGRIEGHEVILDTLFADRGEGPGELSAPSAWSSDGSWTVISDIRGISVWHEGAFHKRFKVFTGTIDLAVVNGRIIYAHGSPMIDELFDVYTFDGVREGGFGARFLSLPQSGDFRDDSSAYRYLYRGRLIAHGDRVYYLNATFGRFSVFSETGTQLLARDVATSFGPLGSFVVDKNSEMIRDPTVFSELTIPIYILFDGATHHQGKLYTLTIPHYNLVPPEDKPIHEFDAASLAHEQTLTLALEAGEVIYAFTVADHEGCPAIYAAVSMIDDVRICIYPLGGCP